MAGFVARQNQGYWDLTVALNPGDSAITDVIAMLQVPEGMVAVLDESELSTRGVVPGIEPYDVFIRGVLYSLEPSDVIGVVNGLRRVMWADCTFAPNVNEAGGSCAVNRVYTSASVSGSKSQNSGGAMTNQRRGPRSCVSSRLGVFLSAVNVGGETPPLPGNTILRLIGHFEAPQQQKVVYTELSPTTFARAVVDGADWNLTLTGDATNPATLPVPGGGDMSAALDQMVVSPAGLAAVTFDRQLSVIAGAPGDLLGSAIINGNNAERHLQYDAVAPRGRNGLSVIMALDVNQVGADLIGVATGHFSAALELTRTEGVVPP